MVGLYRAVAKPQAYLLLPDPVNHELDRDVITIGRAPFVASGSRI